MQQRQTLLKELRPLAPSFLCDTANRERQGVT